MYVFISQKNKFFSFYSCSSVKVLESPGISLKVLERSWNFDAKSPRKSEKKVLESPGKPWNLNQFFWWEPCYNIVLPSSLLIMLCQSNLLYVGDRYFQKSGPNMDL